MIIDHRIVRNSGATLEPAIYKYGHGVLEQGIKMRGYPGIFVQVLGLTDDGYVMPMMGEPLALDLPLALERLADLWAVIPMHTHQLTDRQRHHAVQVEPLTNVAGFPAVIKEALATWHQRTLDRPGKTASVVHGDPTLENYVRGGYWLDPSIRALPPEAELDGGKLLQSYFDYGRLATVHERRCIRSLIQSEGLDVELCIYYLLTHVVRLYGVQPQAREWAVNLATNVADAVKELQCK